MNALLLFILVHAGVAVAPSPDVSALSLESCKIDIVSCDINVFDSRNHPAEAIRTLYFNAYNHLIQILSTHCSAIKSVAIDAVRMKQVPVTEDEVKQARDLRALFESFELDKKWNDLHFFDVAIMSLPVAASKEKEAAHLVLSQYKSYLTAYTRAVSIKEGKAVHSFLQRNRGREEKMVVTEIPIDKEIDEYTCHDLLNLWKLFLIETLEIPEDRIEFRLARAGNSTTLDQAYIEDTKEKLVSCIKNCLHSFSCPNKVWSPLICSLLNQVPEPKQTQLSAPYSAGPAELSISEPVVEVS